MLGNLAEYELPWQRMKIVQVDERGARQYERGLSDLAGAPPVLDVVHLGLGGDGQTASPCLDIIRNNRGNK